MADSKQEWPKISDEERIQHETLFFSQGPLNGYLTAEKARDVFLKSGLPLQVLSQIWNLADVSNDNLLNVHEFVLAMHLTLGVIQGLKPPVPLPRHLTPPKSDPLNFPLEDAEREAYRKIFKLLDKSNNGFIEAEMAREVFSLSGLTGEQLGRIWDIADLNRDGSLDPEEWMVACHLIRTVKKGQSVEGTVNVYDYLPDRIAQNSLQARKKRVEEYEQKKQRLMALKEKRKQDVNRESKRLDIAEKKLKLCRDLYNILRKSDKRPISTDEFKVKVAEENAEITRQEEIVYRLKKEHEKVRQNTVKIILEEQKLNDDIRLLKRGTDELNKKLRAIHTKATKDPDPFHQLYEQKKEKRVTLSDIDSEEIYIPFIFDPFDAKETSQKTTSGEKLFRHCDSNNHKLSKDIPEKIVVSFKNIDDSFTDIWSTTSSSQKMTSQEQEDSIFKPAKPSTLEDDPWFSLHLSGDSLLGEESKSFADLQRKLVDLKNEIQKLNMDGDRLVFKNPEDYTARKRAKEEEERAERSRHQRRGIHGKENVKRHTISTKTDEATQAAREYRIKRRSLNYESGRPDNNKESPILIRRQEKDREANPSRPSRSKRLSSSEEVEAVEQESSSKPPVVEKLDLSGLNNGVDESKSEPQKTEPVRIPDRALKENNFQETRSQSVERPLKIEVDSPSNSPEPQSPVKSPESSVKSPESPLKSPTRSTGKKTRAPAPPGSGPTSPRSPSSEQEAPFQFSQSPPKTTTPSVETSTSFSSTKTSFPLKTETVVETTSFSSRSSKTSPRKAEEVVESITSFSSTKVSSTEPSKEAARSESAVKVSGKAVSNAQAPQEATARTESNTASVQHPAPVAPPRKKKNRSSLSGQASSSSSASAKPATSPEKSVTSPRTSEILTEGSTSFNTSLDNSPNRSQVSKRLNDSGITDVSFDESKEKPVIISDSLESEIFGYLKGSQLFKDTQPFSSENDKTVKVSTSESRSISTTDSRSETSPKKVTHIEVTTVTSTESKSPSSTKVKQEERSSPNTESVRVKSVVTSKTPNGAAVTYDTSSTNSYGGARPKVRDPVKKDITEVKQVKQEIKVSEKREDLKEEEEEIETIIEEVIEFKTSLDASGKPILDTNHPSYQLLSSKKTVHSQAVETKDSPSKSGTGSPVKTEQTKPKISPNKPKLEELELNGKVKSPKRKAPAPPVPESVHLQKVQNNVSKIEASPSSTPPSARVKDKRSSIHSINGGAAPGYESDASDASSVPPPLPDSAPPPFPADGPPVPTGQVSCEEIVEVEFKTPSIPSSKSSSTGNIEALVEVENQSSVSASVTNFQSPISSEVTNFHDSYIGGDDDVANRNKSVAQMRADFFGLSKPSTLSIETEDSESSALESYFSSMRKLDSGGGRADSDSEEESGFSATFSPGDSGIQISSLPTSPNDTDGSIQLISYSNQSKGDNSFVRSSIDSAYDESSTLSSIDFDSRGDNQNQDGVTSPRSKVYNPTEIVDKARQFAEIVQKPNFVVKRETSGDDDFNQDRLQELEMARRAVISEATMKKKFGVSSPTDENLPPFYEEPTEQPEAGKQQWVLEEEDSRVPEVGWTGRPNSINLYSENVVKEGDTTEDINRESIRDLSSTRQQWETILSPLSEKSESNKKQSSGTVRHWEVNFPNRKTSSHIDVHRVDSDTSNASTVEMEAPSTESAIEREIRLNMEREAMLRKEQEERKELIERQKGKVDTTMYENVTNEEPKPTFHELTEADRGSELWKRETIIQQELREQEEKERALRRNMERENERAQEQPNNGQTVEPTESIIEKEIRIQREREAELQRQREISSVNTPREPEPEPEPQAVQNTTPEPLNDINHNTTKSVSYEDAIANNQHEGESLIARELREAREREEELQKQRQKLYNISSPQPSNNVSTPSTPSTPQQSQQSPASRGTTTPRVTNSASRQATWQKDVSPFLQKSKRSGSVDSLNSSHSTGRTPSDFGTPTQEDDGFIDYKPKSETPIEREIRLARERENELRRSKGLPELPEAKKEQSGPPTTPVSTNDTPRYMRSYYGDSSNTMKKYSSSRLQQEIIKQKERELDLRKEGRVITTAEEHIELPKYVAVTGQETTNSSVKKNFVTRKSSTGLTPTKLDESDSVPMSTTPKTTPKAEILKNRKVMSSGGAGFSYKESRNTAESKIERELREMREREEELRKQRISRGAGQAEEASNGV